MRIAIALFEGVEELDFAGPWEVLAFWSREVEGSDVEVFTVGASLDPVTCAKGLRVLPDRTWLDLSVDQQPLDVLIFPGGRGTRPLVHDEDLHDRLNSLAAAGTVMTSVCTGALVYAAAGLLRGRPATTYWSAFDELHAVDPTVQARPDARWVDDGSVITAAGVSAGIDMALHLIVRFAGAETARAVRRGIQYDPEPPV